MYVVKLQLQACRLVVDSHGGCNITRNITRFSLTEENEQADAGRDGRTRVVRPNSQARTEMGRILIFPVQLTTGRIVNSTKTIAV